MKNIESVETVDVSRHAKTRVLPNPDLAHVRDQNMVALTLKEFGPSSCNFPIVFVRNPDNGKFRPVAMFGLRAGENLYYGKESWHSTYAPMMVARHPFVIGYDDLNPDSNNATICLEKNSAYLSETEGEPLYDENGGETEFLKNRARLLMEIFDGERHTEQFMQKLQDLGLIRSFELILQPRDAAPRKVTGMHTIDERRLRKLDDEELRELFGKDYLPACYFMLSSLFQIHRMIKIRNQKGGEIIASYQIEMAQEEGAAQ